MTARSAEEDPAGYGELIRNNVDFRRLWIGNVVSLLGDWFNTLAIYALVAKLTGSPMALGTVFIAKMLPWALASPIAGILVDRLNRRRVMIASDLLRAVVVLGFLTVETVGYVELIFGLTALQVIVGAVFEPARSAALPSVVSPRELVTANALSSVTWSFMLAAGAAAGGLVTEWLGTDAVFVIDSLSYLVSAFFIYRTAIPQRTDPVEEGPILRLAAAGIVEGWRHLIESPAVARIALVKATWSLGGGALIYLLALLGREMSPTSPSAAIGFLLAVRGIGTGIGPFSARILFRDSRYWPTVIGACFVFTGLCYAALSFLPWTWAVAALVGIAHTAGGTQWVLSTILLQRRTVDRFRGRVFATEWLMLTLADATSIFVASMLIDRGILDLRGAFLVFGLALLAAGVLWSLVVLPIERSEAADRV